MYCDWVNLGDGVVGVVCRGGRRPRCSVPGCPDPVAALCDWKLKPPARRKTCSAKLCAKHTTKPTEGKDLCPPHAARWEEWKAARAAKGSP